MGELTACRASNPRCGLRTGYSLLLTTMRAQPCEICCSEANFCPECRCLLCCGEISFGQGGVSDWVQCLQTIGGDLSLCGHSAHLECAVRDRMAGVVPNFLDVEYLCRRCDKKMDLLSHVTRLVKSACMAPERTAALENASLCFKLLQGTKRERIKCIEEAVRIALDKAADGANIQAVLSELVRGDETTAATAATAAEGVAEGTAEGEAETAEGGAETAEGGAEEVTTTESHQPTSGSQRMQDVHAQDNEEDERHRASRDLVLATYPEQRENAGGDRLPPFETLLSEYQHQVDGALTKLRGAQQQEFEAAKTSLTSQMYRVLDGYKSVHNGVEEVKRTRSPSVDAFMDRSHKLIASLGEERLQFETMLRIGDGFGSASKDFLREAFDWPPQK